MGFDVFGIEPENENGEYFRNNIWWWPRLWDFCCHITPEISEEDRNAGHHNDGLVINGEKHSSMIRNLKNAVGEKEKYSDWIEQTDEIYSGKSHWSMMIVESIAGQNAEVDVRPNKCRYPFDWQNVEEFLEFIKNNKGFKIC